MKFCASKEKKHNNNNKNLSFQLNGEREREEGGTLQCCDEGVEKEREQDGSEGEGDKGGTWRRGRVAESEGVFERKGGGGYLVDAFILPSWGIQIGSGGLASSLTALDLINRH